MVGRHRMRAEFWIGKLFVNALLDDHGAVMEEHLYESHKK
jgi:hypothetical protein